MRLRLHGQTRTADGVIDRMGLPAIATVLIDDGHEDAFNANKPHQDRRLWSDEVEANLLKLSGLDGSPYTAEQAEDVVYRYRPRYNDDVNDSWMCDPGRRSYARASDTRDRIVRPSACPEGSRVGISWPAAICRTC